MSEFIEILSPKALSDLEKANTEVLKLASNIDAANQKLLKTTTPSGSDSAVKELTDAYKKQEQTIAQLQKQLQKLTEKENDSLAAKRKILKGLEDETKARQALDKQRQSSIAAIEKENAKLAASQTLQARTNAQLKKVQAAYDELATKKARYNNLTDSEEKRLNTLTGTLQKYRAIQDGVNTTVGKFGQRVGAYVQTGFNPLSNSINQLTREMPAFANSVGTGFMAISNNLPIFFDAMGNVIARNKELQAQGQPTQSAFKQLAASVFSWGTALGLGVTLLTLLGPQIWESISGSKAKKEALEKETKALEEKARAEDQARESFARYSSDEISKSKILLETAKNVSLSYKERISAVNELQKRYPDYLGSLSKEQILAGDTANAENKLNDALMRRGIALASQQGLQDEITNSLKNQKWLNDKLLEIQQKREELGRQISQIDPFTKDKNLAKQYEELSLQLTRLFYLEGTLKEQYKDKNNTIQQSIKFYLEQYNANAKYLGVVKEETSAIKKNTDAKKENIRNEVNSTKALEEQISALKDMKSRTDASTLAYSLLDFQIQLLENTLKAITGGFNEATEAIEDNTDTITLNEEELLDYTDKAIKAMEELSLQYAKTFSDSFVNAVGLTTFFELINGGLDKFGDNWKAKTLMISEAFQEMVNFMSQLSQQNFEQERERLEQQKNIAILFAGDSEAARAEIEKQAERRRKEIAKREAKAKKELAIFNVIIDTGQAIVAFLAQGNIPASIMAGIIGAAQLAMIQAQKIPQYFKGTDNAAAGLAWTQEKGREIITDKQGRVKSLGTDKGATLTMMEAGDKVFTAEQTKQIMFNRDFNNLMMNNGITTSRDVVNSGMSEAHVARIETALKNVPSGQITFDELGYRKFHKQNGRREQRLNAKFQTQIRHF